MVLNDIIEQAAGRPGRASEQGGKYSKQTSQCVTVGVSVQVTSQNPPLYVCFHVEPLDPVSAVFFFFFFFFFFFHISGTGFSNYDTVNLFVRMNDLGLVSACARLMQCHVMKTSYIVYAMVDDGPRIVRCRTEDTWRLVTLHLCVHWPLSELYLMYIMLILLSSSCD